MVATSARDGNMAWFETAWAAVPWEDFERQVAAVEGLLRRLAGDPALLGVMARGVVEDEELMRLCESPVPGMLRLTLYRDPVSGARLRLHTMVKGHVDPIHSHRCDFGSLLLQGGYNQSLYAPQDFGEQQLSVEDLTLVAWMALRAGGYYFLHHSQFHSLQAVEDTVTLSVRGPDRKPRSMNVERDGRLSWPTMAPAATQALAGGELPVNLYQRTLDRAEVVRMIQHATTAGLIGEP